MDTLDIGVVALAEDHAIEGSVKLDPDPHQILLTLHLQVSNLGHVGWLRSLPRLDRVDPVATAKAWIRKGKRKGFIYTVCTY